MRFDEELLDALTEEAKKSARLRMNRDMRTQSLCPEVGHEDASQRMLSALEPGSVVPVHRHPMSNENVICLCGKLVEVLYDDNGNETERYHLDPSVGNFGCVVPVGAWHTVEVLEPSVIYEAKDGRYGQDGSETLEEYKAKIAQNPSQAPFPSSLGDLKKNIEYLIGKRGGHHRKDLHSKGDQDQDSR